MKINPSTRYIKAYSTTLLVLTSYILAFFKRRIFGEAWMNARMGELHRRNAKRIESAILELKGLFIKVGQMLSIMSNFLPEDFRNGLEGLQNSVPPHSYPDIEARFQQEFGKKPEELYKSFEKEPIASASLGQVHVAYLEDGTKVAVKIQYPEIEEVVRVDLKTLRRIFGVLHLFFPPYGMRRVYEEIADVIQKELDYLFEGKNLESIRANFKEQDDFLFPDVFWDYSTSRVLTLRFMEGVKVSSLEELKNQKIDPKEIATKIIHAYCKMIFLDGVYHADPHPGNLLIQSSGKIVLVDFGALARISDTMQEGITQFAEGLIKRDTRLLATAMRKMGFVARETGMEPFERLIEYFYAKFTNLKIENFKNLNLSDLQNMDDLIELKKLKVSFKDILGSFHVPRDWLLLERTMLLVVGLTSHLEPSLNPVEIVLPYVEKFVLKDKSFSDVIVTMTKEIGLSYIQLPHEIHKTLKQLNSGTLSISTPDLKQHTQRLYILGHQFLYAFLGLGGTFLGVYLEEVGKYAESMYAYVGAALFGAILLVSFLKNRRA